MRKNERKTNSNQQNELDEMIWEQNENEIQKLNVIENGSEPNGSEHNVSMEFAWIQCTNAAAAADAAPFP